MGGVPLPEGVVPVHDQLLVDLVLLEGLEHDHLPLHDRSRVRQQHELLLQVSDLVPLHESQKAGVRDLRLPIVSASSETVFSVIH